MAKAKSTAEKPVKSASLFRVLLLTVSLLVAIGVLLLALLVAGLALVIAGILFFRWRRARKTRAQARQVRAEVRQGRAAKARRGRRAKRDDAVAKATEVAAVNDPMVHVPVADAVAA